MSVEILLIPIGIAAFAAWREARSTDLCERCRTTRITDQELLLEALQAMGATSMTSVSGRVVGQVPAGSFTCQKVGDVFLARIDGAPDSVTIDFVGEVEQSVGRVLHERNVKRVRERAEEMGMSLLTLTQHDGTTRLVFEAAS